MGSRSEEASGLDPGQELPDYGVDAPVVLRRFTYAAVALLAVGGSMTALGLGEAGAARLLRIFALGAGTYAAAVSLLLYWGSRVGKFRIRDRLMDQVGWSGKESVLDVGCGHGLLTIEAAKRAPDGFVAGIDIWDSYDQAENCAASTLRNARLEGVEDRLVLVDGDARHIPLASESFDVVVSCLALHNIPDAAGRARALGEMLRVLRPGGRMAIADIYRTSEYMRVLEAEGVTGLSRSIPNWSFGVPAFRLICSKGGGAA